MTAEDRATLLRQLTDFRVAVWREGDVFVRMAAFETESQLPKDDEPDPDPRFALEELYKDQDEAARAGGS